MNVYPGFIDAHSHIGIAAKEGLGEAAALRAITIDAEEYAGSTIEQVV